MNARTEKTITVIVSRNNQREITVVAGMRLADIRTALGLPESYQFSHKRCGDPLADDVAVFHIVRHGGRLHARFNQKMEQMAFDFNAPLDPSPAHDQDLRQMEQQ